MKNQIARRLALVGLVALVVGFVNPGTAWGQLDVAPSSITYRNGTAMFQPLTAMICRGTRVREFNRATNTFTEIEKMDTRASETLVVFGMTGDVVTVDIVDATGTFVFADVAEPQLVATIGGALRRGAEPAPGQLEVRLRAVATQEVQAPAPIQVKVVRSGVEITPEGGLPSAGGVAFVLYGATEQESEGFPMTAPRPDGTLSDTRGAAYFLPVRSIPAADILQRLPVEAQVRIRGQVEYKWSASFPAGTPPGSEVVFRYQGEAISSLASLNQDSGLIREPVPVPGRPLPADVDDKAVIDLRFRETEEFEIGANETWGFRATVEIARQDAGATGTITAEVDPRFARGTEVFIVELVPICPF